MIFNLIHQSPTCATKTIEKYSHWQILCALVNTVLDVPMVWISFQTNTASFLVSQNKTISSSKLIFEKKRQAHAGRKQSSSQTTYPLAFGFTCKAGSGALNICPTTKSQLSKHQSIAIHSIIKILELDANFHHQLSWLKKRIDFGEDLINLSYNLMWQDISALQDELCALTSKEISQQLKRVNSRLCRFVTSSKTISRSLSVCMR